MKIVEYTVVTGTLSKLSEKVAAYLEEGWQPYGSPFKYAEDRIPPQYLGGLEEWFTGRDNFKLVPYVAQAMVKYASEEPRGVTE